jgi:hypothetical protein
MAADDGKSGSLFEGLLIGDEDSKNLATKFADANIKIVSPTVSGFLKGIIKETSFQNLSLAGCNIDYLSEFQTGSSNEKDESSDAGDALIKEFAESAATFVSKVSEIRAPYIPPDLSQSTSVFGIDGRSQIRIESFENAFMRMLGLPSDSDLRTSQDPNTSDNPIELIYFSPEKTESNGKVVRKTATLDQILGNDNTGPIFSHILAERRIVIDNQKSGKRIYNFSEITDNDIEYFDIKDAFKKATQQAEGTASEKPGDAGQLPQEETVIGYHNPDQLFRFFYLKSVPMQDSSVYNCITDSSKIVAKPFDTISYQKINGIKPKTSLLETIIRLRLDRITGNPGIYAYDPDIETGIVVTPDNVDKDKLTEIECFLIQKLKGILYLLSKKYISEIKKKGDGYLKELNETGKVTLISQSSTVKKPTSPEGKAQSADEEKVKTIMSELENLEILKAKEDAILFLLKDTSSSYSAGGSNSEYSSLDIQEGIIRTASGFSDILSGPLYSILSHRSEQLGKLIKEKRQQIDSEMAKNDASGGNTGAREPGDDGLVKNPGKKTYTYYGIRTEDFIVYILAFLLINQDYLIGLLPYENRRNLANTISNSIMSTGNKNKDPYGVVERINKSPEDGGFPSVKDSVNALSILVSSLYEEYISYIKNENLPLLDKIKKVMDEIRSRSNT